jgi:hypothetical protein
MGSVSKDQFKLTPADEATLAGIGLQSKKGTGRPLGINVDHKGRLDEVWKADYSIVGRKSVYVSLSDGAKQADHPFLALREAYDHITKLPVGVALTSPAHITGRQDSVERDRVLGVIDGLIAKASGVMGAGAPPKPPSSLTPPAVLAIVLAIVLLTIKMVEPIKSPVPQPMTVFALPQPEPVLFLPGPPLCTNSTESIFDNPWALINTMSCGIATLWADLNSRPPYEPF